MGQAWVAGIDESGPGTLAGPVLAVCVLMEHPYAGEVLPANAKGWRGWWPLGGVRDAKRLGSRRCAAVASDLARWVVGRGGTIGIGLVGAKRRIERGEKAALAQAHADALRDAIGQWRTASSVPEDGPRPRPAVVLVDGLRGVSGYAGRQIRAAGADRTLFLVAAASILARALRDQEMVRLDDQYPGWDLARHKGAALTEHLRELRERGPGPAHIPHLVERALRREEARRQAVRVTAAA